MIPNSHLRYDQENNISRESDLPDNSPAEERGLIHIGMRGGAAIILKRHIPHP